MFRQLNKRITEISERTEFVQKKHIKINGNVTTIYTEQGVKIYDPSNTGIHFHNSNARVRLCMGAYGSGKTTMCLHETIRQASFMPPWHNGIRKSKWAIIRNTSGELMTTTLPSWLMWFDELGMIEKRQKPVLTYEHAFYDEYGRIEIELVFLALDNERDIRKLKSAEFTNAYLNELSEIPKIAFDHISSRLRYPSEDFCKEDYRSGIIADTNPPDTDHWIYKAFEQNKYHGYELFKQPPGLLLDEKNQLVKDENGLYIDNPEHDNYKHLKNKRYYSDSSIGKDMEYIKVYCLGQYGSLRTGKIVYPEYNDDFHSVEDIEPIIGLPLYIGQDFGLTPATIVVQFTARGQLILLKEYISKDMSINTFTENVLIPGIKNDFPGFQIKLGSGDPAGIARNQAIDELSCIGVMNSLGLNIEAASTNDIQLRLNAVKFFLTRMCDGKPSMIISRKGCPIARKGFIKDYFYKLIKGMGEEEKYTIEPYKNSYSHIHDAIQYIALRLAGNSAELIVKPKHEIYTLNTFNWS